MVPMEKKRNGRGKVASAAADGERLRWLHPALRPPREGPGAALENLSDEEEILSTAVGVLSALTFLEREGWPLRPGSEAWVLDHEGYPRWSGAPPADDESHPRGILGGFLVRLLDLCAAKTRSKGASGRIRRSFKSGRALEAWFQTARPEGGRPPRAGPLLLSLLDIVRRSAPRAVLPASYGMGWVWSTGRPPRRDRLNLWTPNGDLHGDLLRACAEIPSHSAGRNEVLCLSQAAPYPYAALEPLLRRALGSEKEAARWLRESLGGSRPSATELGGRLASTLNRIETPAWFLWPSESIDPESRMVLSEAARGTDPPIVVLGPGGSHPPGNPIRAHFVWLTPLGSSWYGNHAEALFGPERLDWLPSLERLAQDSPRCGGSLIPPLPSGFRNPASRLMGRNAPAPLKHPGDDAEARCLREADAGHLASLAVHAEGFASEERRLLWRSRLLLEIGQAPLALKEISALDGAPDHRGETAILRARAYERLGDYSRALKSLPSPESPELPGDARDRVRLLRGHFLGLLGRSSEGEDALRAVLERNDGGALRVAGLCHLATTALLSNDIDRSLTLLAEAEEGAGPDLPPLERFLLLHRKGLAALRLGRYDDALRGFRDALELACSHGFRHLECGSLSEVGNACRMLGRMEEAADLYGQAEEGSHALGLTNVASDARFNRAITRLEAGEPLEARRVFEEAVTNPAPGGSAMMRAIDHLWLGTACFQLGDLPRALEASEAGLRELGDARDPSVRIPLLCLRGEILLRSGQRRKLANLLRELESLCRRGIEKADRLDALTVMLQALRTGDLPGARRLKRRAGGLPDEVQAEYGIRWRLALARFSGEEEDEVLREALSAARESRSCHGTLKVLHRMHERGIFPPMEEVERSALADYLVRNRIRGPLRTLLPLLQPPIEPEPRGAPGEAGRGDLEILLQCVEGEGDTLEELMEGLGALAGCLLVPGSAPRFQGELNTDRRRRILSLCPEASLRKLDGMSICCEASPYGPWCALAKRAEEAWPPRQVALVRAWIRLQRRPAFAAESRTPPGLHPAVSGLLLTRSPAMAPVLRLMTQAAEFDYPVLITGEPGTGKEVCARALHAARGSRRGLVAANCANLSPTLSASLLFGHRRGSFTGADQDREGLVYEARGGTLFLDEIGELPLETQAQLLRFMQDGTYLPLGATRTRSSDARIVAATNRDLEEAAAAGLFREDLFFRLNVIRVEVPPLRERPEDIPFLFDRFLEEAAREAGRPLPEVDGELRLRLAAYGWPGNVRELRNTVHSLLVAGVSEGTLRIAHLPRRLRTSSPPHAARTLKERLERAEIRIIESALARSGGNLSAAARDLGLTRQGLARKMKRLGIRRGGT